MSSKRRIQASRRNGALSRGPKTAAGKSRSSQNARRHGLLAKRVVLENENEENFQIVLDQHIRKFQPRDGVEFGMIEEMTASYWRLHRALAIETQLFDEALARQPEGSELARTAKAWAELADTPRLQTLFRYQAMLHNMHRRAMNNLLILQDIEPDKTPLPNEPNQSSGPSADPPEDPRPASEKPAEPAPALPAAKPAAPASQPALKTPAPAPAPPSPATTMEDSWNPN